MQLKNQVTLFSSALGKCEHCLSVFNLAELTFNHNSKLICNQCGREITGSSLGYTGIPDKDYAKTHWVGPDGEWTEERPEASFICLGRKVTVGKKHLPPEILRLM